MAAILSRPQCVNSLWPCDATWVNIGSGNAVMACNLLAQAITWTNADLSMGSVALTCAQCYMKCSRYQFKKGFE